MTVPGAASALVDYFVGCIPPSNDSPAKMNRKKNSMAATLTSNGTASRKHTTMDRSAANLRQAVRSVVNSTAMLLHAVHQLVCAHY